MDKNLVCVCETLRESDARPRNESSSRTNASIRIITHSSS